jgi:hypothetical protein
VRTQGRRREDLPEGQHHGDLEPGDYWKILDRDSGDPLLIEFPGKLTTDCWHVVVPMSESGRYGIADLRHHTVREHDDGTISVLPNDGSSNSILVSDHRSSWHGFVYEGVLDGEIGAGR